ncbi:MAG: hypothetical protein L0Y76_04220 [Ignavibacteria bacterium]|nr:hypothetical protein [Ignavibacteria bacterium]
MNRTFISITAVLFSLLLSQSLPSQTDSTINFSGLNISLTYSQGIYKKDIQTGEYAKLYEEREIKDISSVVIKKDFIYLPGENKNLAINNLLSFGMNGVNNSGSDALTGGIIGFLIGAIPTVIAAVSTDDEMASGIGLMIGGLLTVVSTGAGILIGSASSTTEYKVIDLQGHDNNYKHKILIESLKKSKTQSL